MAEKEYIERRIVLEAFSHRISELSDEPIVIGMNEALSIAEEFVKSLPAADVAPVRHGHWNTGYFHDRVCSCCLHPDNDINDYAHSYCPHCGAKMDGGD